jgi:hypothetical protein
MSRADDQTRLPLDEAGVRQAHPSDERVECAFRDMCPWRSWDSEAAPTAPMDPLTAPPCVEEVIQEEETLTMDPEPGPTGSERVISPEPTVTTTSSGARWYRADGDEESISERAPITSLPLRALSEAELDALRAATVVDGELLRRLRKLRGVDLQTIAERTKISLMTLRFIEEDRHDVLPARIYLEGFLRQVADLLDLPSFVVDRYLEGMGR